MSYHSAEMQSEYYMITAWTPGYSLGESYPSAEMQSVYCTVPADWATGHSLGESYHSAEMQSVYCTVPVDWARIKQEKQTRIAV